MVNKDEYNSKVSRFKRWSGNKRSATNYVFIFYNCIKYLILLFVLYVVVSNLWTFICALPTVIVLLC